MVGGANGAVIEGLDGREYLDFVGGIGCQNLGHGPEKVVAAVHAQVDRFLHQMSMVVSYEGYVDVCRLLGESSPCAGESKSMLINSGAEAIENAVKISRAATGRPAVLVFDRGFHGRTLLAMTMTSKLVYKKTFGPFAPEIYRVPAPYEYRGITSDDASAEIEMAFKADGRSRVGRLRRARARAGRGRLHPDADGLPGAPQGAARSLRHPLRRRRDPVRLRPHRPDVGDRALRRRSRTSSTSGKTLGGGLPLAAVTGRAEVMDAPHLGGLGGTFAGNPVSCAAATVVLEELDRPEVRAAATRLGERMRAALDDIQSRVTEIGDVRGLGPMLAIELVTDRATKEPAADLAARTIAEALDRGLLLMGSGIFSNCIRFLPPLNIEDAQLESGLQILEESLVAAGAARRSR